MIDIIECIKKLRINLANFYWSSPSPQGHYRLGLGESSNIEFVFDSDRIYTIKRCMKVGLNEYRTLADFSFSIDTEEGKWLQSLMFDLHSLLGHKDFSSQQEEDYFELVAATELFIAQNFYAE